MHYHSLRLLLCEFNFFEVLAQEESEIYISNIILAAQQQQHAFWPR